MNQRNNCIKKFIEKFACKIKSFLKLDFQCINDKNFKNILNLYLYKLRTNDKDIEYIKEKLKKWFSDENWLKEIKNNITNESNKDIPKLLKVIEDIIYKKLTIENLFYYHLIEELNEEIISESITIICNNNNINTRVLLLDKIIQRIEDEEDEKNKKLYINVFYCKLKEKFQSGNFKYELLFVLNNLKNFKLLEEEYQKDIKEKRPNIDTLYNFDLNSLLLISKYLTKNDNRDTTTMEDLKNAYTLIELDKNLKVNKVLPYLNFIYLKSENKEKIENYLNFIIEEDLNAIKEEDEVKIFISLMENQINDKNQTLFTIENVEKKEQKKDDKYFEILKEFAGELFKKQKYESAIKYSDEYLKNKFEIVIFLNLVNCLSKLKRFSEILYYESFKSKTLEKMEEIKLENKNIEDNDSEKRIILVILDKFVTAYTQLWLKDKKNMDLLEDSEKLLKIILESTKKLITNEKLLTFYVYPVYKYIWTLDKLIELKPDDKFQTIKDRFLIEHYKKFKELYEEFPSAFNKIINDTDRAFQKDTEEDMKEKHKIFKKYFINEYELNETLKNEGIRLFAHVAKYVAIEAKVSKISKDHFNEATKYLYFDNSAKELLKTHDIIEIKEKVSLVENDLRNTINHEKIIFDMETKELWNKYLKDSTNIKISLKIIDDNSEGI